MPSSAQSPSDEVSPGLREARYSLREMLREVDNERRHSVLGMELVDQGEIGAIFKSRVRRKPTKAK